MLYFKSRALHGDSAICFLDRMTGPHFEYKHLCLLKQLQVNSPKERLSGIGNGGGYEINVIQ